MPRMGALVATVAGFALALVAPAQATVFVVTKQADSPTAELPGFCSVQCTLREAVTDAQADPSGPHTIKVPAGTYVLANDALQTITRDITIEGTAGAAATVITGATTTAASSPSGSVIAVNGAGKLTLRGVSLVGNTLTGTAAVGGGAVAAAGLGTNVVVDRSVLRGNRTEAASNVSGAGAIAGQVASVTVVDSAIEDNVYAGTQPAAVGAGAGGIANDSGATQITRSSVSRNRGDLVSSPNTTVAGGINQNTAGSLAIADSTVSGNSVSSGGADFRFGGILVNGSLVSLVTLTNVTLTDNVTSGSGSQVRGNLASFSTPTTTVRNSIVAGGFPDNCIAILSVIASSGGNLDSGNSCGFTGPGDLVNTDAQLGALRANGGLGLTQAPRSVSPVFGLARAAFCSASDQRGIARPQGGACDSGAVEAATVPVSTALPSISGTPAAGRTLTCNPGTFTQAPALAFQWLSDGAAIPGATGSTFVVTAAQLGTAVQCQVTAANSAGQTVATSAAVVSAAPPASAVRPSFRGTLRTGQRLTCSRGSFVRATSFAFAWLRNGRPIARATAAAYRLTAGDAGTAIQCRVTASGPGGAIAVESAPAVPAKACIVPAVGGLTLAAARRALAAANCALGRTARRRSAKRPGTVLASTPPKGRNLAAGTKVALTLARA